MLCTSRGRYTCRHKNKSHEPSFSACLYFCSSQCSTIKFSCPAKCFQSVSQCNTTSKHSSHFFANAPRSLPKHKTKREKAEEKHPLENVTLKSGWWSNSVNESPKGKFCLHCQHLRKAVQPHEPYASSASSRAVAAARPSPCTALASSRLAVPPQGHEAKQIRAISKEKPAPGHSWEAEGRATLPERRRSNSNLQHLLSETVFLNK